MPSARPPSPERLEARAGATSATGELPRTDRILEAILSLPTAPAPDRVYLGGTVRTMSADARHGDGPLPTAFASTAGTFTAVGSDSVIAELAGPSTEIIDLAGATVLPGFIETHLHPIMLGMNASLVDAGPDACPGIEDLIQALVARRAEAADGEAVIAAGFDDSLVAEDRGLTVADLDRVSDDRPVMVRHLSGHGMYVNSFLLRDKGIDADTVDPVGGVIVRFPDGEPTGELREVPAMNLVNSSAQMFPPGGLDAALRSALATMAAVGVTSFHDLFVNADMLNAYQGAHKRGELSLRARPFLGFGVAEKVGALPADTDMLAVGGVKLISDGSLQLHTGALTEPYHDLGGCECGQMAIPAGDLDEMVAHCHAAGRQVAIHTNGDLAIDLALDAIERAAAATPGVTLQHRLEHVQTLREDQIARMRSLGVAASVFVNHVYYWGDRHRDRFLGPERGARISPLASITAAGVPYALHCDCPVTPVNPLFTIDTAVNRVTRGGQVLGPEQRISPMLAVAGYTSAAAAISGEQRSKGSIEPGKFADFVLLDADPLALETARIKDIAVLATYVGGLPVYSRG